MCVIDHYRTYICHVTIRMSNSYNTACTEEVLLVKKHWTYLIKLSANLLEGADPPNTGRGRHFRVDHDVIHAAAGRVGRVLRLTLVGHLTTAMRTVGKEGRGQPHEQHAMTTVSSQEQILMHCTTNTIAGFKKSLHAGRPNKITRPNFKARFRRKWANCISTNQKHILLKRIVVDVVVVRQNYSKNLIYEMHFFPIPLLYSWSF